MAQEQETDLPIEPITETTENITSLSDLLALVPDGVWSALAAALLAAIGWFGKTAFDAWKLSRRPYKQDQDRYSVIISSIDPSHLYYFKDPQFNCVYKKRIDGIDDAAHKLDNLHSAEYLNSKLTTKENRLRTSLLDLSNILCTNLFHCRGSQTIFTMYWDSFDEWQVDDQKRANVIQTDILGKVSEAITAFEDYRDYGNRLFADRLVKAASNA